MSIKRYSVDMQDFDPEVVRGWDKKLAMQEWELSKFVPFVKLYAVVTNENLSNKKPGDAIVYTAEIHGTGDILNVKLVEIGGLISQTNEKDNYRGGIGITDISTKYQSIEAGMLEVKLGLFLSNLEQMQHSANPYASKVFMPGNNFLIVYGWQTNGNYFELKSPGNNVVDLRNFDEGMRRFLYCTLHSYNWEFGDQGRISGSLNFFTPDTIKLGTNKVDISYETIANNVINLDDVRKAFEDDINRNLKREDNYHNVNILNDIKLKEAAGTNQTSQEGLYEDSKGLRFVRTDDINRTVSTRETYIDEKNINSYHYIYFGWIIEIIKYINNSQSYTDNTKIYIIYKNLKGNDKYAITFPQNFVNKDNKVVDKELVLEYSNLFFIPIKVDKLLNFISNFKGNFRNFLNTFVQFVNDDYPQLSITKTTENGIYIIDDFDSKLIIKENELRPNGQKKYTRDAKTPVITYGFSNSLTYNVKITSTIPPDIIWAQYQFMGDDTAKGIVDKAESMRGKKELEDANNITYKDILQQFDNKLKEENKTKELVENDKSFHRRVLEKAIDKNQNVKAVVLRDIIINGQIALGSFIRNYFNGLTFTIHGTTGFQAWKCFLFKGYELSTNEKGIDGLYTIVLVNDMLTPRGYETVVEAARVNTLSVV